MTTATNGTTAATETTPTVATTPPAVTPAPKKKAPRVRKAVIPASLPAATATDPTTVPAVLNTLTGTAIQAVKEKGVVKKLLGSLLLLTAYADATPDVLAQLKAFGIDDPKMLVHGRWALAMLQAAQAKDAAEALLAEAAGPFSGFEAALTTQQRVVRTQIRLALEGNAPLLTAFGLTKAPAKKKAAAKAPTAG
jgi:hypothetical protein